MSIASRLTDLVDTLITVINARNAPGPDAYQMAVAGGFVGDRAAWQQSLVGNDEDYAAYLNGLLTTPPRAGAASEVQTGVTQFATLTEALTGASATKALSALRHANVHLATSFTDLNSKAASLPPGSVVALAKQDMGGGAYLYRSLWGLLDGIFRPITPLLVSGSGVLTTLASQIGYGRTTYPTLTFEPYVTTAIIDGSGPPRDEWAYIGLTTGFMLWRGGWSITNGSKFQFDARSNRGRVDGAEVFIEFSLSLNTGQTLVRDDTVVVTPYTVPATTFLSGAMTASGGAWAGCAFWTGGANINLLTTPSATAPGTVLNGSGTYQRVLPTA